MGGLYHSELSRDNHILDVSDTPEEAHAAYVRGS